VHNRARCRPRPPNEHSGLACPASGGEPLRKAAALWDGSRRLPKATQDSPSLLMLPFFRGTICADAGLMRTRWVVPGSRLLQNHRAAILESGSPPGLGQLVRAERLQTYRVHFSPFRSLGFSGFPRPRIRPCGVMEYCATANCTRVAGRDAEATE
jgi:hypothetical protein